MLADHVEDTLEQFSRTFTVCDIMTACSDLKRADTPDEARTKSDDLGFDVIPYPISGPLQGYFYRGSDRQPIKTGDMISDGTGLLDLPTMFQERGQEDQAFFFVLSKNEISGFVHFSDLNKSAMKSAIYMMMEATERHVLGTLRAEFKDDEKALYAALSPASQASVRRWLRKPSEKRADLKPLDVIGWPQILEAAKNRYLSHVDELTDPEIKSLRDLRDGVSHSGELLVGSFADVQTLINGRRLCANLRQ